MGLAAGLCGVRVWIGVMVMFSRIESGIILYNSNPHNLISKCTKILSEGLEFG